MLPYQSSSPPSNAGKDDASARKSGRWWKCLVSIWLCYHFTSLVISPLSIPPSSQLVRNTWRYCGPYLQALYMNQGHHFFAPDPGASTLVSYTVERSDGTKIEGQIPNRGIYPRLLYHRHFMLTESLANIDSNSRAYSLLVRSLARELCAENDGQAITLTRVTHLLPSPEWIRAGERIDDPTHYEQQPLGRFEWSDFSGQ